MGMIDAQSTEQVKKMLAEISKPVALMVFTRKEDCQFCEQVLDLVREVADLNDLLSVDPHDLDAEAKLGEDLGIEKVPAILVRGESDPGHRFYGVPAGGEFTVLVESILDVGTGRPSPLTKETLDALSAVTQPLEMKVFFTPTCPHCPRAVRLAQLFALGSEQIRVTAVEAGEFPDWVQQYAIQGVPKTVINETVDFVGAQPEPAVLEHVLAAAKES